MNQNRRKIILLITVLWAAGIFGAYYVATSIPSMNATKLSHEEVYVWSDADSIAISPLTPSKKKYQSVSCFVSPSDGSPKRTLSISSRDMAEEYEPWFSGSATLECGDRANIYSGGAKDTYLMIKHPAMVFGMGAFALAPLLVALTTFKINQKRAKARA